MHGSIPLHTTTTTCIESRTFSDWEDAKAAELIVAHILSAEKRTPRRALADPDVRRDFIRLIRICQRATIAADPESRTRVVAHHIPGVRYVRSDGQTVYELFFSVAAVDHGSCDMAMIRADDGKWSIVL